MQFLLFASGVFLIVVFVVSIVLAIRGSRTAKYFLWIWALLMTVAIPMMNRENVIPHFAAGLMFLFFIYAMYMAVRYGIERVDVSHEETRLVLAESNRRIDEERRTLARRLHDEVNPQLLLTRNVLKRLEPMVADNTKAVALLSSASEMLNDAYAEMRDIIKNTRIEIIDSIGLIAALESLVAHYTNISDKPSITLEHNMLKKLTLSEASAISLYKIIREAIFNAIKHSKAKQVHVSVQHNKMLNTYSVEVSDDGLGMSATERNTEHAGIGLIDMRERVRVLGGTLKVQAVDPKNMVWPGTKISFSFSA